MALFAACVLAFTLLGVALRNSYIVTPSTDARIAEVARWRQAGLSAEHAAHIVTGVPPPGRAPAGAGVAREGAPSARSPATARLAGRCQRLAPIDGDSYATRREALLSAGFPDLVTLLDRTSIPEPERIQLLDELWQALCGDF